MGETLDTTGSATDDEGGVFDPQEAARILEQTAKQARREFEPKLALGAVVGAGVFLFGYGAVWWSFHDQHPYGSGPALWSIAVLYGLIALSSIVGGVVLARRNAGISISRQARRQQQVQSAAIGAALIGAAVFMGALRYLGVSFEIVYGVYGPTVPLIAAAAAAAGVAATREKWLELGACVAVIAIASGSGFFGPLGAWGLTGLGCCMVLLVYAAALVVRQRRA